MLNGEKFKNEIAELGYDFALTGNNIIIQCGNCDKCKFYGNKCLYYGEDRVTPDKIKWLLEEYKEPILTNKEKTIIEDIIKAFEPFGKKVEIVKKDRCLDHLYEYFLFIEYSDCNGNNSIPDNAATPSFSSELFAGMEFGRTYTLEELGLC